MQHVLALRVSASNVTCNDIWNYVFRPARSPVATLGPTCFGPKGHLQTYLTLRVAAHKVTCSDIWTYVFQCPSPEGTFGPTCFGPQSPVVTLGPTCFGQQGHLQWLLDIRVSASVT